MSNQNPRQVASSQSPAFTQPPPVPAHQVNAKAKADLYFKNKLGYSLHDPEQNVVFKPHESTKGELTEWLLKQVELGRLEETAAPDPQAGHQALLRDELS